MNHLISHQDFMGLHAEINQLRAENKQLREWNKGLAEELAARRKASGELPPEATV